ncbi:cytochrome c oxidase assembly protein COX16 homolog, mitochondrial-like [Tigriopus californicus]|uniref:cytochrome c oxidase assembly protein COX16 homolog, mitochondrial-like n=1 Tax=Tigriopus californicus TaxID=6832 RepID=UPI0027DA8CCD|nr:cytochrome c oxidase assembly protein COX16 homolog, mitochondrial-like [Tigriopus californicus]|eukprot:TCALIF_00302-PA protein Name:"Similar to COX16 Cytochrome c oxidase assembly protein COX16 homolog, mitochondrial (Bos taurus)" AED:0.49 eAED:0.49 QI:0/-1/0/1/-1/1/1/0/114
MRAWLARWRTHSFVRYGLPFLVLTVGGSFVLSEFTDVRFRYQRYRFVENEFEASGRVPGAAPTLEDEYRVYQAETKNQPDDYEMIRGPRPWEAGNTQIAPARLIVRSMPNPASD